MKKLFLLILMVATCAYSSAQTKKVSVLGDSYSTFIGVIPANYATTICGTGYGGMDASRNNFISRVDSLGNPDIIFVFGGTNDAWARAPIGEYQYSDWTKDDCKNFRPALACLIDMLQKRYATATICCILNSELGESVNESMREICKHYQVQLVELHDIEKQNGHPSINGMKSIFEQLLEAGL